jgi:hypothetical protein
MAMSKLWAVFDDICQNELPLMEVERIKSSFTLHFGERDTNPVKKVSLEILKVDGHLQVVPVATNNNITHNEGNEQNALQQQQQEQHQQPQNQSNAQVLTYIQHVQQENVQRFDLIQSSLLSMRE